MPARANTSAGLLGFAAGVLLIYAACIGVLFSGALREAFGGAPPVVAHAVAAEIAVLRYGLLWWTLGRSPASATENEAAAGRFPYHTKSGWGAIVGIVMFLGTGETTALHVWAAGAWGSRTAWLLSALGTYGLIWLWGDWQAARRRPLLLTGNALYVRIGLRWDAVIPLNEIARVQTIIRASENARGHGPDFLRATLAGVPQILVTLHAPRVADGPFGLRKRFLVAGLSVDEPDAFVRALVGRLQATRIEAAGTTEETPSPKSKA